MTASPDPLDRLWAAAEQLRGQARGGRRTFAQARGEYRELLAAIAATRRYPVADVSRAAGLSPAMIRRLRAEAGSRQ